MSATGWTPVDESAAPTGWTPVAETAQSPAAAPEAPSFLQEAGHLLAGQVLGAMGAPYSAYQEYENARNQGESVSSALGRAAFHLVPNGDAALNGIETALGYKDRRNAGYGPIYSSVAPVVAPQVGVNLPEMEQQAAQGHTAAVLAGAAVPIAETAGAGAASELNPSIPDVRGAAREALTTPKGTLKPGAAVAAKIAGGATGAAIGAMAGHPGYGAIAGEMLGTQMLRGILGERPPLSEDEAFQQAVQKGVRQARIRQAVRQATQPTAQPSTVPAEGTPTNPSVIVAPEPSPTPAGVREGSAFSVPREQLPGLIQQGSAGAGEAFRSAGGNIIYAPRGAGIEAPDISALRERMSPAAQEAFGPQFTAEQYGDGTTRQVTLHQGGQQQGYVLYDIDPKGVASVNSSLIGDPKLQGKGLGVQMYQKAIEDARAAGASSFQSGDTPEPGAVRVWESLRKSYPVEKIGSGYRIDLTEQPALAGK